MRPLLRLGVLLMLLALGWGVKWVLFDWSFRNHVPDPFRVVHGAALLGGWSAVIWRVLTRMDRPVSPGVLPLVLAGMLADRMILSGLIGAIDQGFGDFLFRLLEQEKHLAMQVACAASISAASAGLILLGGLGAMCAMAGTWDLPWAKASMAAAGMAVIAGGSMVALGFAMQEFQDRKSTRLNSSH